MNFITAEPYISSKAVYITKAVKTVMDLYESRGSNITGVHGYNKFNIKTLKAHLIPIFTHIYGKEDHVGDI